MRHLEHQGARALAAAGLLSSFAYLCWRLVASLHGAPWWLALPALLVDLVGVLATSLLAWALWPELSGRLTSAPPLPTSRVDVVVRVDRQSELDVRATLLALRTVDHVDGVVVLDLSARPSIAGLANEFQAVYAATDPDDRNGLQVMPAAVRAAQFLLLDAGDVPTRDIVAQLAHDFRDPHVAVVQGLGVSVADDSPEHGPGGRHELVFERAALNPALGRRGHAMWTGSGSLVRTDSLRDITPTTTTPIDAHWRAGVALWSAGWRITAPSDTAVVAHRTIPNDDDVQIDRVRRARAARGLLLGRTGACRSTRLTVSQRAALLAWAVRPLSGLRRVVFVAVVCGSLLAGAAPFTASTVWLACAWLPGIAYTSVGLALLSGWTLRPGDRARWSLHTMGPACRSLLPHRSPAGRGATVPRPAVPYGSGLAVTVAVLSAVIAVRGLSERVTHTLRPMPRSELLALLVVSLWLLGLSLDLLRMLARRGRVRRSPRVGVSMPGLLGSQQVSLVDVTPLGAGVRGSIDVAPGERMTLESALVTATGRTPLRVQVVVRNVRRLEAGDVRVGVEFLDVDDAMANALIEFCTIEPAWVRLGAMPGRSVTEARPMVFVDEQEVPPRSGRAAVRVLSMLALAGAIASSIPATAEASDGETTSGGVGHWSTVAGHQSALSLTVLVVAGMLACSLVLGLVRPRATVEAR